VHFCFLQLLCLQHFQSGDIALCGSSEPHTSTFHFNYKGLGFLFSVFFTSLPNAHPPRPSTMRRFLALHSTQYRVSHADDGTEPTCFFGLCRGCATAYPQKPFTYFRGVAWYDEILETIPKSKAVLEDEEQLISTARMAKSWGLLDSGMLSNNGLMPDFQNPTSV
jgi:hypothetical protein